MNSSQEWWEHFSDNPHILSFVIFWVFIYSEDVLNSLCWVLWFPQNLTFLTEYRIVIIGASVLNSMSYTSCICPCSPSWNEVRVLWLRLPESFPVSLRWLSSHLLAPRQPLIFITDNVSFPSKIHVYQSYGVCTSLFVAFLLSMFLDSPVLLCHAPFLSIFRKRICQFIHPVDGRLGCFQIFWRHVFLFLQINNRE